METTTATLDTALSLSELAARLGVTVQTIYDLRSQGRGPRGFRVGRELRLRVSGLDARLAGRPGIDALAVSGWINAPETADAASGAPSPVSRWW